MSLSLTLQKNFEEKIRFSPLRWKGSLRRSFPKAGDLQLGRTRWPAAPLGDCLTIRIFNVDPLSLPQVGLLLNCDVSF